MNEQEQQLLKEEVEAGSEVIWNPDNQMGLKVVSVTERKFKHLEQDEPGLCANFSGGDYVALYNAELSDFVVTLPLTRKAQPKTTQTTMDNDKQREAEIQKLCADVLQMSADCYESGGGTGYTRCPLCCEEVRVYYGSMDNIKHDKDCGYLIAKGLSTVQS